MTDSPQWTPSSQRVRWDGLWGSVDAEGTEDRRKFPAHVVVEGLKFGWGSKFIDVRGPVTIWAVGVLAVLAVVLYGVYRVEHVIERHHAMVINGQEHNRIILESMEQVRRDESLAFRRRMDIQNCISMFSFEERKSIRQRPYSFSEVCPWIEPEPKNRRNHGDS